jgi:hypothetical protein
MMFLYFCLLGYLSCGCPLIALSLPFHYPFITFLLPIYCPCGCLIWVKACLFKFENLLRRQGLFVDKKLLTQ